MQRLIVAMTAVSVLALLAFYLLYPPNAARERVTRYATKYNLSQDTLARLYKGMPMEDALKILGEPHDLFGSGMIGYVYEMKDGLIIIVYFNNGIIDEIDRRNPDGTLSTIIWDELTVATGL